MNNYPNATDPSGAEGCSFVTDYANFGLQAVSCDPETIYDTATLPPPCLSQLCSNASFGLQGDLGTNPIPLNPGGAGQVASTVQGGTNHNYQINVPTTCSPNEAFATIKSAGMSAPGAPAAKEGFTPKETLAFGNNISQYVNSTSRTIVNTTIAPHIFYPGSVTIQVNPNNIGGSDISITGTGSGKDWLLNDIIGYGFFGGMAGMVSNACAVANGAVPLN